MGKGITSPCAVVARRGREPGGGGREAKLGGGVRLQSRRTAAEEVPRPAVFHTPLILTTQAHWKHSMDGSDLELLGEHFRQVMTPP